MTRCDLVNITHENLLLDCEVENAIEFVRDMLEFLAEETEKNEPYAVNSIKSMRNAAREVDNLLEIVYELEV